MTLLGPRGMADLSLALDNDPDDVHTSCGQSWADHTPVIRDGKHTHACPNKPDWFESDLDRRFHLTDRPTGGPADPDPEDALYE